MVGVHAEDGSQVNARHRRLASQDRTLRHPSRKTGHLLVVSAIFAAASWPWYGSTISFQYPEQEKLRSRIVWSVRFCATRVWCCTRSAEVSFSTS